MPLIGSPVARVIPTPLLLASLPNEVERLPRINNLIDCSQCRAFMSDFYSSQVQPPAVAPEDLARRLRRRACHVGKPPELRNCASAGRGRRDERGELRATRRGGSERGRGRVRGTVAGEEWCNHATAGWHACCGRAARARRGGLAADRRLHVAPGQSGEILTGEIAPRVSLRSGGARAHRRVPEAPPRRRRRVVARPPPAAADRAARECRSRLAHRRVAPRNLPGVRRRRSRRGPSKCSRRKRSGARRPRGRGVGGRVRGGVAFSVTA